MTILKVCTSALNNFGSKACDLGNPFLDAESLIFTSSDFEFDSFVDFATFAKHTDAVKAKQMFPLHEIIEIEDQSEDARYYEAPGGLRIPRKLGKYRHYYMFNKGLEVHKALQSFRNANLRVIIGDSAGNICAYSPDGVKVAGFQVGMINPEKMKWAGQDDTPAWTPLALDQKDSKQWNEKGVYVNPEWDFKDVEPVANVVITVISAIATLIVLKVAYIVGIASDGSDDDVPIAGIVEGDFVFTVAPAGPMVDNGDGTYNFPGVGMASGSVTLEPPATAASVGDPIESNTAVITIA